MHASFFLGFRKGFVGLLCGIGLLGSATVANAAGWVTQASPVTDMMFGMDCASGTCIQVGVTGTVIRSTDYMTWTEGTSGVTTNLVNVDVYSATTAIAVGMGGTILKTTDGGATWSSITGVTTEDMYGVSFISPSIAYIAGQDGHVFKTTDAGITWTDVGSTLSGIDAYTIDAYSTSIVYVAGKNGVAYKTTDGGTTWTLLTTGTTEDIYAVDAVSSTFAFIGGANAMIAKTTDGATFSLQTLPDFAAAEAVTDLSCTSGSLCLLSGSEGIVEITGDGGTTWTEEAMPSTAVLGGVANVAVGRRFVGGFDGAIFALDNYGPNEIENLALSTGGISTTDTTPTFTWTEATDDESSVVSYEIDIDSAESWEDIGDVTEYTLTTELGAGEHAFSVRAIDEVGNESAETNLVFTVSEGSTDTTDPTVGTVTPTSATQDESVTFTVVAIDDEAIYHCYLVVDGDDQGPMTEGSSSTYTKSYTPAVSGEIEVSVWCGDTSENVGVGDSVTVTVAEAEETDEDTTDPTVGAITPDEATAGTALTLYVSVADSGGMGTCVLYVDSAYVGSMTISGGYASRSYTFDDEGDAVANAYCTDAAGNSTRGDSTTIEVIASSEETDEEEGAVDEADFGSLIKLACGSDADTEDPCHAVYYFDGMRHAFPNEKVFFTWYEDFDDVVIVTDGFMSSIVLGYNVTYHPGSRMVKFVTQNTVYAVGEDGELRAIASEEVAESIWGSDWNTLIDDISDAFYGNYRFGDDIDSTSDFDPEEVEDSVTDIDEILDGE